VKVFTGKICRSDASVRSCRRLAAIGGDTQLLDTDISVEDRSLSVDKRNPREVLR
jgi:hypothetical protein